MQFSPSTIPGRIVAFAPMDAPRFTTVFEKAVGFSLLLGNGLLVNETFGPMNTRSSR
jgi:hypothetical protein